MIRSNTCIAFGLHDFELPYVVELESLHNRKAECTNVILLMSGAHQSTSPCFFLFRPAQSDSDQVQLSGSSHQKIPKKDVIALHLNTKILSVKNAQVKQGSVITMEPITNVATRIELLTSS